MNRHFVSIKVDREERPDLDAIYMEAVQAATGHGGWPMSIFATPEGLPFLAGTYFPDRARHGMPAFGQVLEAVIDAWGEHGATTSRPRRETLADAARAGSEHRRCRLPATAGAGLLGEAGKLSREAVERLRSIFDAVDGGFGSAPKFPQPPLLDLLLRDHVRTGASEPLEMVQNDPRGHGLGRHLRPPRRRLRPLLGRPPLVRAPFREDALRPGSHRPGLPARLAARRRPPLAAGAGRDDLLRAARPEGPWRRPLLGRGRRLGGRGGALLRLDTRGAHVRARIPPGRGGGRLVRGHAGRQLRGPAHGAAPGAPRRSPAAAPDRGGEGPPVRTRGPVVSGRGSTTR